MHSMPILFWSDLASCHYDNVAKKFYEDSNINVVPKDANPPNCPELRPIKKYWAHIKRKLKTTKYKTSNIAEFPKMWWTQSKSITNEDEGFDFFGVDINIVQFHVVLDAALNDFRNKHISCKYSLSFDFLKPFTFARFLLKQSLYVGYFLGLINP